jgi:hypothetical protein
LRLPSILSRFFVGAGLVAGAMSLPVSLDAAERQVVSVAAVDEEVEQVVRYLEWRAPSSMDPVLRRQVATAILDECRIAGMDPYYVLAVIEVESDFEPGAVSDRNARGLMQLRDVTIREVKRLEGMPEGDVGEPEDVLNVRVGIRYLSHLHHMYGDRTLALAAWNAGPAAVRRELAENGAVPDRWLSFSRRVLREHRRLLAELGPDRPDSYAAAPGRVDPAAQD